MSDAAKKAEQKLKLEKYKEELAARKAAKSPRATPDTSVVVDDEPPEENDEQRARRLDAEAAAAVAERLKATEREREAPKDLGSVNSLLAGLLAGGDDDDGDDDDDHYDNRDGGGEYGFDQSHAAAGASLSAPTGAGAGGSDAWATTNNLLSMLSSSSVYDELAEEVESFDIEHYEAEMKASDNKLADLLGRFEETSIYDDVDGSSATAGAEAAQQTEEAILASLPGGALEKLREAKRLQDLKMAELEAKIQQASRLVVMAQEKGVVSKSDSSGNDLKMMDVLNRLLAMVDDPAMVARLQQSQDFQKAKPQYHFDRFEKMTDEYRAKEASQDDAWARKKRAERLMELQAVREQIGDGGPQPSDNFFKRQDAAQRAAPKGRLAKTK